jgi:hypothetical protein
MDARALGERLFWLAGLAVVVLFAFPPDFFWDVTLPGAAGRWAALALVLPLVMVPPRGGGRVERALSRGCERVRGVLARAPRAALGLGCFVVVSGLLLVFRSELSYGDSLNVARFVERGEWFHKRAPLSIATMQAVHKTLGAAFGLPATTSVQLVSSAAGGLALLAVADLARTLTGERTELRPLIVAAVLSSAASLLFFGYIEHYGLASAAGLWALALGTRAAQHGSHTATSSVVAMLAALIHGAMLTLLVPTAFLVWHNELRRRPRAEQLRNAARALGPALALAAGVIALMHIVGYALAHETGFGGSDRRMFVVWSEVGGYSRYTFLSAAHGQALWNQWLLVMPAALPGGLIFAAALFATRGPADSAVAGTPLGAPALLYLALCGTSYLGLTIVWNPDLGPLGDWDLFAPAGLFANAALAALVTTVYWDRPRSLARTLLLIAGLNASRAVPWVAVNCFP